VAHAITRPSRDFFRGFPNFKCSTTPQSNTSRTLFLSGGKLPNPLEASFCSRNSRFLPLLSRPGSLGQVRWRPREAYLAHTIDAIRSLDPRSYRCGSKYFYHRYLYGFLYRRTWAQVNPLCRPSLLSRSRNP
jgi:hypothetical protein